MALRITVDIFSGRPNPVVVIDGKEEKDLLSRIGVGRKETAEAAPAAAPPGHLGYRGIILEPLTGERGGGAIRVLSGVADVGGRGFRTFDPKVEDLICDPRGPLRLAGFDPDFFEICPPEIFKLRERLRKWRPPRIRWPTRLTCRCAPLWEPQWWNDAGQVQWNNNCYNYASNYRSDTYAQPGLAAGAMYQSIICSQVKAGAVADKLIDNPTADNKCPPEGHLVALVVGPNWDFHWYRKGRNGYWTHKPGGTQATQYDNSNKLISDPRTADRGSYTDFCSFMTVMHGHIKLQ